MTNIDRCDKLYALQFRLECGAGLLDVIYECMRCSQYATDAFLPAVYAAYEYFAGIAQTAKECKEAELAESDAD